MEKSADALSFLSIPTKRSDGFYELHAKAAADAYLGEGAVRPDLTLSKVATSHGLGKEPVHRLVELTNHEINQRLAADSDDQTFTFPAATIGGVMGSPGQPKKAAEEVDFSKIADFGVYDALDQIPDYRDYLASVKADTLWQPQKQKEAADEPEIVVTEFAAAHAIKVAEADAEYKEYMFRATLTQVRDMWEKLADDGDRSEFLLAASCVLGENAADTLAKSLNKGEIEIDHELASKYAGVLDKDHELVVVLSQVKEAGEDAAEAKQKLAADPIDWGDRARELAGKAKDAPAQAKQKVTDVVKSSQPYRDTATKSYTKGRKEYGKPPGRLGRQFINRGDPQAQIRGTAINVVRGMSVSRAIAEATPLARRVRAAQTFKEEAGRRIREYS